jgi:hypothetical protein
MLLTLTFDVLFSVKDYNLLPVANRNRIPIMANTNNICIKLPTAAPNPMNPINHPMIKRTINKLIIPFIVLSFIGL